MNNLLLHIDHFSTFPDTDNLDKYLKKYYEELGFVIATSSVKQHPGLFGKFVLFTGEYLEFNIIEDKNEFFESKKRNENLIEIYKEHRPYNIGYITQDIEEIYEHWRVRGYQVEDVAYLVPRNNSNIEIEPALDPTWCYIPFPSTYAQGVKSYVIEYKKRNKEEMYKFVMGENGIYGLKAITLVTNYPDNRGEDWSNFFYAKNYHTPYLNECIMSITPHIVQWITPQKFSMIYKTEYIESKSHIGELYVLHLLSKDLNYTKEYFEKKGKKVIERRIRFGSNSINSILLERNPKDGFLFAVSEEDPQKWLKMREDKLKEKFN